MDERLSGVSPLNPFNPLGPEWRESCLWPEGPRIWQHDVGVRQQVSLAPQAPRVPEQGRMMPAATVQQQIAQALR